MVAASSPTVLPSKNSQTYQVSLARKFPVWKSAAQITSPSTRKAATVGTTGKAIARRPASVCACSFSRTPASADMEGSAAALTDIPNSETGSR